MIPDQVQLVAITFENGSIGIMSFVVQKMMNGRVLWERMATTETVQAEINKSKFDAELGAAVRWRFIEPGDLPQDRTYRGAWIDDGKDIKHDMPKAREIHKTRLLRKQMADEAAAMRQSRRDVLIDPRIEAAQSVEALKGLK